MSRRLARLGEDLARQAAGGADPEQSFPFGVRPAREPVAVGGGLTEEAWWDDHTRLAPGRGASASAQLAHSLEAAPGPLQGKAIAQGAAGLLRPTSSGRHAAARSSLWELRPRVGAVAPAHVAVVALVALVAIAVTCWWLVRGSPEAMADLATARAVEPTPVAGSLHPVSNGGTAAAEPADQPSPTQAGTVTVDVAGKVRRPGIAVLESGARVADALEAAGGAKRGVDLTALNLARVLVDGEQILVGVPPAAGAPRVDPGGPVASGGSGAGAAPSSHGMVNLNTATEAELDSLPGVGPVTAAAILRWREEHGGFSAVDELLEVDGIGTVTLSKLTPYLTV